MPFAVLALDSRSLAVRVAALCQCSALAACAVYKEDRVAGPPSASAKPVPAAPSGSPGAAGAVASPAANSVVAPPTCVPLANDAPCEHLPRLPQPPVIDGKLECGLALTPLANGAAQAPERSVQFAAAVSDAGLYLYVAVAGQPISLHAPDQPLFCGDAVELFVDADGALDPQGAYDSKGTLQFVIAAAGPTIEAAKYMQGKPFGPWVSNNLAVTSTADGYTVETLIGAADLGLWSWQPAGQLGFDLAVDFAASGPASDAVCSSARTQTFLKVAPDLPPCAGQPWCDTRSFCGPRLSP
jgi:hypothetical protein